MSCAAERAIFVSFPIKTAFTIPLFLLSALLVAAFHAPAQDQVRSPAELAAIAKGSQLDYTIDFTRDLVDSTEWSELNKAHIYRVPEGGGYKIEYYTLEIETKEDYERAEAAYARKDYATAEKHYRSMLELQPELSWAMGSIGECLARNGQQDSAMVWWQRAVDENFCDYLPHWFLADAYQNQGENDKAAAEIALAWVLNRNHPGIRASALDIFDNAGLPALDLNFRPNYLVEKKGSRVALLTGEEWTSYGLCKALWEHEPGFGRNGNFDMREETECLAGLLAYWKVEGGKDLKKRREYQVLKLAVEERFLAEFIFFELWLPREPAIVFTQPREGLVAIAEYVMRVRGRKK